MSTGLTLVKCHITQFKVAFLRGFSLACFVVDGKRISALEILKLCNCRWTYLGL